MKCLQSLSLSQFSWLAQHPGKLEVGKMHGVAEDTEQTYVEIYTLTDLLEDPLTDWSTLGMILSALPADVFHHE